MRFTIENPSMHRALYCCAVVLLLLFPFSLEAADQAVASCYRLKLQDPPNWITSGTAWDKENERLLMIDPVSDRVVSYNLLGERDVIETIDPSLQPAKIARSQNGFLLELVDGSMLSLNRRLVVTRRSLPTKKLSSDTTASLYQWAPDISGGLTAFAGVPHDDAETQYGFFYVHEESGLKLLLSADARQKDFFLHGYPFIASASGETFFLSMSKHPAIYRVSDGEVKKLNNALPRKYATRPDLATPMRGPREGVARYRELETLSIPSGLYAQDGYLYLLTREPADRGRTTWWLYQIDPAGNGSILGRVRLPTTSSHLTVIPTPDRGWMFIQKGKVVFDPVLNRNINDTVGPVVVVSNAAVRSRSLLTSCPEEVGILWSDQRHSKALFVPETLLASKMLLPVDLSSQKNLDLRLERGPKMASRCDFLEPSMGQGTLPDASNLMDLVTSSQAAVVGRIVNTESGWDARMRRVVTKVELEVSLSLKGPFLAGTKVAFLSPGGSMLLAGKNICTSPRKGFYQPQVGDQIVVSAEPSAANSRLLEYPYVFPLSEGKIQPEPYPALRAEQSPVSLSEISSMGSM